MSVKTGRVRTLEQATGLALREAGAEGTDPEMCHLFSLSLSKLSASQVRKALLSPVRAECGRGAPLELLAWWQVAVPLPRYEARDMPSLIVEARVYLVASLEVIPDWSESWQRMVAVEPYGRAETTVLPLRFLQALLDGNEGSYRIVGKDGQWTSFEVAGLRQPLRLHDGFVARLRSMLRKRPLSDWLDDFGPCGRALVPLVVGALLGLRYRSAVSRMPVEEQPWTTESLIELITGMGYGTARAQRVLQRAGEELKPGMAMKEAAHIVLKYIGMEE
jgi:hypothetical protein